MDGMATLDGGDGVDKSNLGGRRCSRSLESTCIEHGKAVALTNPRIHESMNLWILESLDPCHLAPLDAWTCLALSCPVMPCHAVPCRACLVVRWPFPCVCFEMCGMQSMLCVVCCVIVYCVLCIVCCVVCVDERTRRLRDKLRAPCVCLA
jgi:hypothetical protein